MTRKLFTLAALALAAPQVAFAAEGGGGANPFAGDFGVALWTLIIFVIVVFVLGKFAWGPVLSTLKGREEFIHDSLAEAKRERDEAAVQLAEVEERLSTARAEAVGILEEGQKAALGVKEQIEAEARQEADAMVERARREIALAQEAAVKDLYTQGAGLVADLTERVVRRELSPDDHQRLIGEAIEELEQLGN